MFLSPKIVIRAYEKGLFPMSDSSDNPYIYWVDPEERGIINLKKFRINKSLKKTIKKKKYSIKIDNKFEKVINLCAKNKIRKESWINHQIIENYLKLNEMGIAKSVECYGNGTLIGGLYGIIQGEIFCGESMFSLETDASKISMVYLAAHLLEGGFKFIDTQFYSQHLKQFGTEIITKENYKEILAKHGGKQIKFPKELRKDILDYFI